MRFNLRALQAFEAVSRHLSVLKAAEELGITSSAVSHQLRILTEDLGYNLIEREGRNIVLTERGLQFARHLQDAFRHVQLAMVEGRSVQNDRVRIAACSSFCQGFLIDLVADTIAQEGGYEIDMRMYANDPQLASVVADIFVTSDDIPQGYWATDLFTEQLVAVCTPACRDEELKTRSVPFIKNEALELTGECRWLLYKQELPETELPVENRLILRTSHFILALEMANRGLGMALVPDFLARAGLQSGELVQLYPAVIPSGRKYKICCRSSLRTKPPYSQAIRQIILATSPEARSA